MLRRHAIWPAVAAIALIAVGASSLLADVNLLDGLYGHWAFDDDLTATTAENTAWDSPFLADATLTGTTAAIGTEAMFGNGLSLGGDGYADVATPVVPNGVSAYTYSVWFKNNSTTGQHYLLESASNWSLSSRIDLGANIYGIFANTSGTSGVATQTALPANLNDWHLLIATYEQDQNLTFYVDGALAQQAAVAGTLSATTGLHIGADRNAGRLWEGSLDDVGVWNRVLSTEEMDYLWNNGTGNAIPSGTTPPVETVDIPNGLIAHWDFNEGGGYTAANTVSAGSGLDGTLVGDAAFVTEGKFGSAVTFDGNFDYIDVENELFVDGQDSYTAACWFQVSELDGTRQMLFETSESWAMSVELSATDNHLKYSVEADGATAIKDSGVQPSLDEWHHLALAYDGTVGLTRFYVDGEEVTTARGYPGGDLKATDGFHIGTYRGADNRWFNGMIDDMAVWDRALNHLEIEWLWNEGAGNEVGESGSQSGLEGDLDGDGFVGSADLDLVRGNWGASGGANPGDANEDGFVNSADLDIVRANWGRNAAAAVPEPATALLLLVGATLFIVNRRR